MAQPLYLPDSLIGCAGRELGTRVVAVEVLVGGYTPQRLRRLVLANGQTAVLKAAPPGERPASGGPTWTEVLRREVCAYRDIPALTRWHPAYLGDFEKDGWVVLLMEDLSRAQRVPPWTRPAIETVAQGLVQMWKGGGQAPGIHERYLAHGPHPTHVAIRGALSWIAGYLLDRLQDGTGPPHVREIQTSFLLPTLTWFSDELGIPRPPVA